jgi:hypothetical protein
MSEKVVTVLKREARTPPDGVPTVRGSAKTLMLMDEGSRWFGGVLGGEP